MDPTKALRPPSYILNVWYLIESACFSKRFIDLIIYTAHKVPQTK